MVNATLTAIDGLRVGHAHNLDGPTGCTVVLCPAGTAGGVVFINIDPVLSEDFATMNRHAHKIASV